MEKLITALLGVAAALGAFIPAISEAGIIANHNETLVRDRA
jgi:hypothetical protein